MSLLWPYGCLVFVVCLQSLFIVLEMYFTGLVMMLHVCHLEPHTILQMSTIKYAVTHAQIWT